MARLARAIYVSEVNIPKGDLLTQIRLIHHTAQVSNAALRVTGVLLFSDRFFVQCLEGPPQGVSETLAKIIADDRHDRIRVAEVREIGRRDFGSWSMKLVEDRKQWTLPSSGRAFDPSDASAEDLLSLMLGASSSCSGSIVPGHPAQGHYANVQWS